MTSRAKRYEVRVPRVWIGLIATLVSSTTAWAEDPPTAPTRLSATVVSGTRVQLSWQDNSSNEAGFVLLRKIGAGLYNRIALLGANATSYADTSVSPSTTYTYITRAINGPAVSAWSNEAAATTPAGPPPAPANLTATPTSAAQINLSWQDQSHNETGFVLLRKTGTGVYARIAALEADVARYADTTARPGIAYTYITRAISGESFSGWSNEAGATIPTGPPAAPTRLTAAIASGQATLTWKDNSSNETGFVLLRKVGTGVYSRIAELGPGTTAYTDPTVTSDPVYTYIARAINDEGASGWSNEAAAQEPPGSPYSLRAGALSSTQVSLTWARGGLNQSGYEIWRRAAEGNWTQVGQVASPTTTFLDSGLISGTIYRYRVRASRTASVSGWSNEEVGAPGDLPWITHSAPSVPVPGSPTRVTIEFSLPAGYTLQGTSIRSLDAQGVTIEFHGTFLTQREPLGSGWRDLDTRNYPSGTYLVRAEMRYTRPDGLTAEVVSPWTSLQVP